MFTWPSHDVKMMGMCRNKLRWVEPTVDPKGIDSAPSRPDYSAETCSLQGLFEHIINNIRKRILKFCLITTLYIAASDAVAALWAYM